MGQKNKNHRIVQFKHSDATQIEKWTIVTVMFQYLISKDIPDGISHFQAKPVGDDEHSSSNPNRISDSMSGLGFSRKARRRQNGKQIFIPKAAIC